MTRAQKAKRSRVWADALEAWAAVPVGTEVLVLEDDGSETRTKTRSTPWELGHGHPVILLEGRTGGYDLLRVRLAALLALVLLGCWGSDGRLFIEDQFSPEEYEAIAWGAEAWNTAADAELVTVAGAFSSHLPFDYDRDYYGPHESMAFHKVSVRDPGFPDLAADVGTREFGGVANVDYARAALVLEDLARKNELEIRSIAMHELGHLLGLHHTPTGVMSIADDAAVCVSRASLRALCDENACGLLARGGCS